MDRAQDREAMGVSFREPGMGTLGMHRSRVPTPRGNAAAPGEPRLGLQQYGGRKLANNEPIYKRTAKESGKDTKRYETSE